jgi:hypothetical protein
MTMNNPTQVSQLDLSQSIDRTERHGGGFLPPVELPNRMQGGTNRRSFLIAVGAVSTLPLLGIAPAAQKAAAASAAPTQLVFAMSSPTAATPKAWRMDRSF